MDTVALEEMDLIGSSIAGGIFHEMLLFDFLLPATQCVTEVVKTAIKTTPEVMEQLASPGVAAINKLPSGKDAAAVLGTVAKL